MELAVHDARRADRTRSRLRQYRRLDARIDDGEAWLVGAHLAPYEYTSGYGGFEPNRPRKLLLHRDQIDELLGKTQQQSLTLIPASLYFKGGRVKVELGMGKGKKHFDKRADIAKRDADRDARVASREGSRR